MHSKMSQLNHSDTSQSGLNGEEVLILMLNASGMIQYRILLDGKVGVLLLMWSH